MFAEIMERYYKTIYKFCCLKLNGDAQAAEDCTQEVFLILYKKIDKIPKDENVKYWLLQTAKREIKKYLRKNPQNTECLEDVNESNLSTDFEFTDEDEILSMLNEQERKIIEDYYTGKEKSVIAKENNISLHSLYLKIYRIKAKLKKYIEESNKN